MRAPAPTAAELAILRVLWRHGASTVRDVHAAVYGDTETGYTSARKTGALRSIAIAFACSTCVSMPAIGAVPIDGAVAVFDEARAICDRDRGALWGMTLCGPMLLLDPADRSIVANQVDGGGVLTPSGSVFVGVLPESEIVANTTVPWSGTTWTEMLWPLPDDVERRQVLIAHEMFHRIQPALGIERLDGNNRHLDTFDGRYLLQLEWRALARALQARDAAARKAAVNDALLFRRERYRLFPGADVEEAALESNEGVAEWTGVKAGLATKEARTRQALRDLSAFVESPSFVRSFAYATGPAYGLLLDDSDPGWHRRLASGRRMDLMLGTAMRMPAPALATVASRESAYDDGSLRAREVARDEETRRRVAALTARFVAGPVMTLPLAHAGYQFNPQTLQPLDAAGTVYPTLKLAADWGVLEVDGGALLDTTRNVAVVSATGLDASGLRGDGWRLVLKAGWVVVPGARDGDLVVRPAAEGR